MEGYRGKSKSDGVRLEAVKSRLGRAGFRVYRGVAMGFAKYRMVIVGLGYFLINQSHSVELGGGAGAYYGSGTYGEVTKTVTRALTAHLKVREGPWGIKAAATLVSLSGPGSIDSDEIGGRGTNTEHSFGPGDMNITASHAGYSADRRGSRSLYGKVKLPLASESKGIGTGKFDWELGVDGARGFAQWAVFGKAGYRWRGDRDDGALEDGGIYQAGVYKNIGAKNRGGVSYEKRQAVRETSDPSREGMVYVERRGSHGRSVTLYLIAGNSKASVEYATGIEFAWRSVR